MRRLWIVRHAKAEPAPSGTADNLRVLSPKGRADAARAGAVLAPHFPEATAVSAAARTVETAELLAQAAGISVERLDVRSEGYLADAHTWWDWIRTFDDAHTSGLVVGHNPGVSYLVELLTGVRFELPTCGLVEVELPDRPWHEIGAHVGKVRFVWTPASAHHG